MTIAAVRALATVPNNFSEQTFSERAKVKHLDQGRVRDKQMTIRRDKLASGNREHVHEKDRSDQLVDDVLEIFSPPRVCRRARSKGFRGGWSLDESAMCFVTGKTWDLLNSQKRKSLEFVLQDQAQVVCCVASTLCTAARGRSQVCLRAPNFSFVQEFCEPEAEISDICSFDSDC